MARGGGGGGRGGKGGKGGRSGSSKVQKVSKRSAKRAVNKTAKRAARRSRDDARKRRNDGVRAPTRNVDNDIDDALDSSLGGIKLGGGAKSKLNNIRRLLKRAARRQVRDSRGRFRPNKTNKEIRDQADEIAADVVKDAAFEIADIVNGIHGGQVFQGASYTKNGIYASLRPGQNGLLQQHGLPSIDKGFRTHMSRDSILREVRNSHPAIQEAMDQTLIDLVDLGQRVRDGVNALNGDN